MIYFSSDYHFGHYNLMAKYCNRPFKTTQEMDEKIILNHNKIVGQDDEIYILGDIAMNTKYGAKCLSRMNGKKYLLKGNHDRVRAELLEQVRWVKDYYELWIQDQDAPHKKQLIILCHYCFCVWNKKHWQAFHCFGHSHNSLPDDPDSLSIDVGVDAIAYRFSKDKGNLDPNQYRPISYEELKKIMNKKLKLMNS